MFLKLLEARPLASRVPLALCSAMQCRKGPSAARKGHMATPAGLDLSKSGRAAGPQALGLGSGQISDMAGVWDLLKDSKPAIKLLQMVLARPRAPKRELSRLKPPNTQHTNSLAAFGTAGRDSRQ